MTLIPWFLLGLLTGLMLGVALTVYFGSLIYRHHEAQERAAMEDAEVISKAAEELAVAMLEKEWKKKEAASE